jgi:hypothetical protein
VYTGGDFDAAGGKGSLGFARWGGALGDPNVTPEQGGTVTADGVGATFPAGAVREAAVATLTRTPQPAVGVPAGFAALYGVQMGATTLSGQQLRQTAQPYTVQATYTDAQLAVAGISDPATLKLLAWDGAAWQPISNGVDTANKVVNGATTQLGALALAGQGSGGLKLYLPAIQK